MKFTILGSTGFIGRHLVEHLRRAGHECFTPERNCSSLFSQKLGLVAYCAGLTADYRQRPFDTVRAHISLLADILEKADFEGLVYLSSCRLYDSSANAIARETDDLHLNPLNARHIYDISKAMGESLCLTAGKGRARVARLSCVYNDEIGGDGFLSALLGQVMRGEAFEVATSLAIERDYIHVKQVVELLVDILSRGRSDIYNVASGVNVSNRSIFQVVEAASGIRLAATKYDSPKPPPTIDVERIRTEFGFSPILVDQFIREILGGKRQLK